MGLREKPTVLVVDDEEPVRLVLTTLLGMKGYALRQAGNIHDALGIICDESIDVLITDHVMPGGTGLDLIYQVNHLYPDTVNILLTGAGDRDLYREAVNLGAVFSLLEKPCANQLLFETVGKAIAVRFARLREKREISRLQEQYHSIFDHTTDLIQCVDPRGAFIYVNPAWHGALGYSEEELPGLKLHDLARADCLDRLDSVAEQIKSGKPVEPFETVMLSKNGAQVFLEGTATGQFQEGEVTAFSYIFRDMTERKRTTAELHARLKQETMIARIADLLARTGEPVSVYGSILAIMAESAGVDAAFMYSLDEAAQEFTEVESWYWGTPGDGEGHPSRIPARDIPWFWDSIFRGETMIFRHVSGMDQPDRTFFRRSGADSFLSFPIHTGSIVAGALWFEVNSPNRRWEENEIGMLKATVDIITNAWTRQNEILVRRQKEIEAEQSRKLAIRADRLAALGTMAAGIIHEIAQPLNAINVSSQTILYGLSRGWTIDSDKITGSLSLIVDQVKRMGDIITNMRAFARDGLSAAREKDNLNTQVMRVFTLMGEQLRAHDIEVALKLDETPDILMNTQQILQVVLNLMVNARQALDEIEREVKMITVTTYSANSQVVLEVADNGPGIPEDVRDKIFNPFFTTKEVGKGTGMGLSISSGIVNDHQGEMDVRNNEMGGATFIVRFPVTRQ